MVNTVHLYIHIPPCIFLNKIQLLLKLTLFFLKPYRRLSSLGDIFALHFIKIGGILYAKKVKIHVNILKDMIAKITLTGHVLYR